MDEQFPTLKRREKISVPSVREWLEGAGLGAHVETFVRHGFDRINFMDADSISGDDLRQMGISNAEDCAKIHELLRALPPLTTGTASLTKGLSISLQVTLTNGRAIVKYRDDVIGREKRL